VINVDARSRVWHCTPIIPALRKVRQEDCEFKASLGYTAKPCFKKKVLSPSFPLHLLVFEVGEGLLGIIYLFIGGTGD
jgi:hypothetical protein